MTEQSITIEKRTIGFGHRPYLIAEMSANHLGRIENALRIIEEARRAGVDAVKLQTYTADTITISHDGPGFRIEGGLWDGRTLHELYQEAATPYDWHPQLFEKARSLGITLFSSPFDPGAVDFLEQLGCPAYKIASFEIVDIPLIRYAASTGKPMIISTGMANLEEIGDAVDAARGGGCREVALLHCVSGYPTPTNDVNLLTIPDLARRFECVVGLSDHTRSITVPVAAVAAGAAIVEKHVTLSRRDGGPDSQFSIEPDELRQMANECRVAFDAMGRATYERAPSERANAVFRRSLYVVEDIDAGGVITTKNVRSIRPGLGLPPKNLSLVLGRHVRCKVTRGTPLTWDLISGDYPRK
jgi:N-acetylneuraminate synthase